MTYEQEKRAARQAAHEAAMAARAAEAAARAQTLRAGLGEAGEIREKVYLAVWAPRGPHLPSEEDLIRLPGLAAAIATAREERRRIAEGKGGSQYP